MVSFCENAVQKFGVTGSIRGSSLGSRLIFFSAGVNFHRVPGYCAIASLSRREREKKKIDYSKDDVKSNLYCLQIIIDGFLSFSRGMMYIASCAYGSGF